MLLVPEAYKLVRKPSNAMTRTVATIPEIMDVRVLQERVQQYNAAKKERETMYSILDPVLNQAARQRIKDKRWYGDIPILNELLVTTDGYWHVIKGLFELQDPIKAVMNTMRFLGDSLDSVAMLVKAPLAAWAKGSNVGDEIANAYGLGDSGRYASTFSEINKYVDFIPDGWLMDLIGEIVIDPMNWVNFGVPALSKAIASKGLKGGRAAIGELIQTTIKTYGDDIGGAVKELTQKLGTSEDVIRTIVEYSSKQGLDGVPELLKTKQIGGFVRRLNDAAFRNNKDEFVDIMLSLTKDEKATYGKMHKIMEAYDNTKMFTTRHKAAKVLFMIDEFENRTIRLMRSITPIGTAFKTVKYIGKYTNRVSDTELASVLKNLEDLQDVTPTRYTKTTVEELQNMYHTIKRRLEESIKNVSTVKTGTPEAANLYAEIEKLTIEVRTAYDQIHIKRYYDLVEGKVKPKIKTLSDAITGAEKELKDATDDVVRNAIKADIEKFKDEIAVLEDSLISTTDLRKAIEGLQEYNLNAHILEEGFVPTDLMELEGINDALKKVRKIRDGYKKGDDLVELVKDIENALPKEYRGQLGDITDVDLLGTEVNAVIKKMQATINRLADAQLILDYASKSDIHNRYITSMLRKNVNALNYIKQVSKTVYDNYEKNLREAEKQLLEASIKIKKAIKYEDALRNDYIEQQRLKLVEKLRAMYKSVGDPDGIKHPEYQNAYSTGLDNIKKTARRRIREGEAHLNKIDARGQIDRISKYIHENEIDLSSILNDTYGEAVEVYTKAFEKLYDYEKAIHFKKAETLLKNTDIMRYKYLKNQIINMSSIPTDLRELLDDTFRTLRNSGKFNYEKLKKLLSLEEEETYISALMKQTSDSKKMENLDAKLKDIRTQLIKARENEPVNDRAYIVAKKVTELLQHTGSNPTAKTKFVTSGRLLSTFENLSLLTDVSYDARLGMYRDSQKLLADIDKQLAELKKTAGASRIGVKSKGNQIVSNIGARLDLQQKRAQLINNTPVLKMQKQVSDYLAHQGVTLEQLAEMYQQYHDDVALLHKKGLFKSTNLVELEQKHSLIVDLLKRTDKVVIDGVEHEGLFASVERYLSLDRTNMFHGNDKGEFYLYYLKTLMSKTPNAEFAYEAATTNYLYSFFIRHNYDKIKKGVDVRLLNKKERLMRETFENLQTLYRGFNQNILPHEEHFLSNRINDGLIQKTITQILDNSGIQMQIIMDEINRYGYNKELLKDSPDAVREYLVKNIGKILRDNGYKNVNTEENIMVFTQELLENMRNSTYKMYTDFQGYVKEYLNAIKSGAKDKQYDIAKTLAEKTTSNVNYQKLKHNVQTWITMSPTEEAMLTQDERKIIGVIRNLGNAKDIRRDIYLKRLNDVILNNRPVFEQSKSEIIRGLLPFVADGDPLGINLVARDLQKRATKVLWDGLDMDDFLINSLMRNSEIGAWFKLFENASMLNMFDYTKTGKHMESQTIMQEIIEALLSIHHKPRYGVPVDGLKSYVKTNKVIGTDLVVPAKTRNLMLAYVRDTMLESMDTDAFDLLTSNDDQLIKLYVSRKLVAMMDELNVATLRYDDMINMSRMPLGVGDEPIITAIGSILNKNGPVYSRAFNDGFLAGFDPNKKISVMKRLNGDIYTKPTDGTAPVLVSPDLAKADYIGFDFETQKNLNAPDGDEEPFMVNFRKYVVGPDGKRQEQATHTVFINMKRQRSLTPYTETYTKVSNKVYNESNRVEMEDVLSNLRLAGIDITDDTVLFAHNAAFDNTMLAQMGVTANPYVLDTLPLYQAMYAKELASRPGFRFKQQTLAEEFLGKDRIDMLKAKVRSVKGFETADYHNAEFDTGISGMLLFDDQERFNDIINKLKTKDVNGLDDYINNFFIDEQLNDLRKTFEGTFSEDFKTFNFKGDGILSPTAHSNHISFTERYKKDFPKKIHEILGTDDPQAVNEVLVKKYEAIIKSEQEHLKFEDILGLKKENRQILDKYVLQKVKRDYAEIQEELLTATKKDMPELKRRIEELNKRLSDQLIDNTFSKKQTTHKNESSFMEKVFPEYREKYKNMYPESTAKQKDTRTFIKSVSIDNLKSSLNVLTANSPDEGIEELYYNGFLKVEEQMREINKAIQNKPQDLGSVIKLYLDLEDSVEDLRGVVTSATRFTKRTGIDSPLLYEHEAVVEEFENLLNEYWSVVEKAKKQREAMLSSMYGNNLGYIRTAPALNNLTILQAYQDNKPMQMIHQILKGQKTGAAIFDDAGIVDAWQGAMRKRILQIPGINKNDFKIDGPFEKVLNTYRENFPDDDITRIIDSLDDLQKSAEVQEHISEILLSGFDINDPKSALAFSQFYDFMSHMDGEFKALSTNYAIKIQEAGADIVALQKDLQERLFISYLENVIGTSVSKVLKPIATVETILGRRSGDAIKVYMDHMFEQLNRNLKNPDRIKTLVYNPDTEASNDIYTVFKEYIQDIVARSEQRNMKTVTGLTTNDTANEGFELASAPYFKEFQELLRAGVEGIRAPLRAIKKERVQGELFPVHIGRVNEHLATLKTLSKTAPSSDLQGSYTQVNSLVNELKGFWHLSSLGSSKVVQYTKETKEARHVIKNVNSLLNGVTNNLEKIIAYSDSDASRKSFYNAVKSIIGDAERFIPDSLERTQRRVIDVDLFDSWLNTYQDIPYFANIKAKLDMFRELISHPYNDVIQLKANVEGTNVDPAAIEELLERIKSIMFRDIMDRQPKEFREAIKTLLNNDVSYTEIMASSKKDAYRFSRYFGNTYADIRNRFDSPDEFMAYVKRSEDSGTHLSILVQSPTSKTGWEIRKHHLKNVDEIAQFDGMINRPNEDMFLPLGFLDSHDFQKLQKITKQGFKFGRDSFLGKLKSMVLMPMKSLMLMNTAFLLGNLTDINIKNLIAQEGGVFDANSVMADLVTSVKWEKKFQNYYDAAEPLLNFGNYKGAYEHAWIDAYRRLLDHKGQLTPEIEMDLQIVDFVSKFRKSPAANSEVVDMLDRLNAGIIGRGKDSSEIQRVLNNVFYNSAPFKQNLEFNGYLELVGRLALHINDIKKGYTVDESLLKVLKTHFNYGNKSKAELHAEFIIPFTSYPLRSFMFWSDALFSKGSNTRLLMDVFRTSWGMDNLSNNDYAQYQASRGNLPVGNIVLQSNVTFADALGMVSISPDMPPIPQQAIRKLNPVLKHGITPFTPDLEQNERFLRTPGVNQIRNIYTTLSTDDRTLDVVAPGIADAYYRNNNRVMRSSYAQRNANFSKALNYNRGKTATRGPNKIKTMSQLRWKWTNIQSQFRR